MPTFTPPVAPSYGTSPNTQFRVLSANLGDGYEQRAGDGLNAKKTEWPVVWAGLTAADHTTITDFIDLRGGYEAFDWTPPGGASALKFKCLSYASTRLAADLYSLSATFEQVFDL